MSQKGFLVVELGFQLRGVFLAFLILRECRIAIGDSDGSASLQTMIQIRNFIRRSNVFALRIFQLL